MIRYVVMSGLPASGKSTLAGRLAPVLGLPVLDKDVLLEALFESEGVGDADWRSRLSRRADARLQAQAIDAGHGILVSWWQPPHGATQTGTPSSWLSTLAGGLAEVHCVCAPEVAAARFMARSRHRGHLDVARRQEGVEAELAQSPGGRPLGIGPVIHVDTEQPIDLLRLVAELARVSNDA